MLNSDDALRNCETFSNIIETTMDMVAPLQNYRISGKQRYIEPWMTKGIGKSSMKKYSYTKKCKNGAVPKMTLIYISNTEIHSIELKELPCSCTIHKRQRP